MAALNRRRHLYSAGRPSHWALAHILVVYASSLAQSGWPFLRSFPQSVNFGYNIGSSPDCTSEREGGGGDAVPLLDLPTTQLAVCLLELCCHLITEGLKGSSIIGSGFTVNLGSDSLGKSND